jgi:hypothetical protein
MTAIVIQHNFIEVHTAINEIPYEKAGVKLALSEYLSRLIVVMLNFFWRLNEL